MATLGCVPYLNARPIIEALDVERADRHRVLYDIPSRLPLLLDTGQAEAVLASSFDAIASPGRRIAAGVSISTMGRAESVRLFSKTPIADIRTLALDQSSLTSNALAQLVLWHSFGVRAQVFHCQPSLEGMLRGHDACVLIGDNGLLADGTGLNVLDLGEEWERLSTKPFVWALWLGCDSLTETLVSELIESKRWGVTHLYQVIERASRRTQLQREICANYLSKTMNYDLSEDHLAGFSLFRNMVIEQGWAPANPMPPIVQATQQLAPEHCIPGL